MSRLTVGVLHPGAMGAAVAGQAHASGALVLWCSEGRSAASRARAESRGLVESPSVAAMSEQCDLILSICPPEHAEGVASSLSAAGFQGVFVEANAIAPALAEKIRTSLPTASSVLDGSIVGSPPGGSKRATLYLSGDPAACEVVAEIFAGTAVEPHVLGTEVGTASALKLAYTTYQKTSRLLVALAHGLAASHGVEGELSAISKRRSESYLSEVDYIPKVAARAWRWGPELREASSALSAAGLPANLTDAAAEIMALWDRDKDAPPSLADALAHLRPTASDPA